jgi:hypothetical protein
MDGYRLPFGRHRGEPLGQVPTDYLEWFLKTCKPSAGLRAVIRAELSARPDAPRDLPSEAEATVVSCQSCGSGNVAVSWHEHRDGRRAIRGDCRDCRKCIGFLPQTAANIALADAALSPVGLLDVLVRAEEEGVELARDALGLVLVPPGRASAELESLVRQHQHQLARHLGTRTSSFTTLSGV